MLKREDLFPAVHSAILLMLLALNFLAAVGMPAMCFLTVPLAALAMTGGLSVVHEAAHRTYFRRKIANDAIGRIFSSILLMNFKSYKHAHMLHHARLGTSLDPEGNHNIKSQLHLIRSIFLNPHAFKAILVELRQIFIGDMSFDRLFFAASLLTIMALATAFPTVALLAFVVPFCLFTVFDNVVSIPEHARFPSQENQCVSRALTAPGWLQFVLYYVNHHATHHDNPKVTAATFRNRKPFHQGCRISYVEFYLNGFTKPDLYRTN